MKPKFKPTPKKTIVLTIGRDFKTPTLKEPFFEDATNKEVTFGALGNILDELATMPQPEQPVKEETPDNKNSIWVSIKKFIPSSITELVTAQ